jgi:hypothetical protein
MRWVNRAWVLLLGLGCSCEGTIYPFESSGPDPLSPFSPPSLACETFDRPSLEHALGVFANDVYPSMVNGGSQCVSCHQTGQGRRFVVSSQAAETFYLARSAGFFRDEPGSLTRRLSNTDAAVRMPSAAAPWSAVRFVRLKPEVVHWLTSNFLPNF